MDSQPLCPSSPASVNPWPGRLDPLLYFFLFYSFTSGGFLIEKSVIFSPCRSNWAIFLVSCSIYWFPQKIWTISAINLFETLETLYNKLIRCTKFKQLPNQVCAEGWSRWFMKVSSNPNPSVSMWLPDQIFHVYSSVSVILENNVMLEKIFQGLYHRGLKTISIIIRFGKHYEQA